MRREPLPAAPRPQRTGQDRNNPTGPEPVLTPQLVNTLTWTLLGIAIGMWGAIILRLLGVL